MVPPSPSIAGRSRSMASATAASTPAIVRARVAVEPFARGARAGGGADRRGGSDPSRHPARRRHPRAPDRPRPLRSGRGPVPAVRTPLRGQARRDHQGRNDLRARHRHLGRAVHAADAGNAGQTPSGLVEPVVGATGPSRRPRRAGPHRADDVVARRRLPGHAAHPDDHLRGRRVRRLQQRPGRHSRRGPGRHPPRPRHHVGGRSSRPPQGPALLGPRRLRC